MSPRPLHNRPRARLLLGASAATLLTAAPAVAGSNNPFARVADPGAAAAAAAQAQATQSSNTTAASQRALAAFSQAAAIRHNMDVAQQAARAAAAAVQSSVPNGLGAGGLDGDPALWTNANAPTQKIQANGRTEVDISQTKAQAILNWTTFNVGQNTDVVFDQQGNAGWVALNRVNDPSANPTQILGAIKAPGTVMILNRNGVIFSGTSQVNVGNLIAAAANMSDDQLLNLGIYSQLSNSVYLPSFTDAAGAVSVKAGAQISTNAPATVLAGGGYVMLLGGSVTNAGAITTPKGQTLLAAGDAFELRPGYSTDSNQYSTTIGSEVSPEIAADSSNGAVANTGSIFSQQGDITLAGRQVTQAGVAVSTTNVNQRGTIHLLNSVTDSQGAVTLAAGSLTTILPELDSTDTALDAQRDALITQSQQQDPERVTAHAYSGGPFNDLSALSDRKDQGRIEIVTGGNILFDGGSYSIVQGGQIAATAVGRVEVNPNAWLDVSGVRDVALDVSSNSILVNIQGNELRDAPANRDDPTKPLYNQNVWVNIDDLVLVPAGAGGYPTDRYYTPGGLLEVSGYLGNVGHSIGEWAAIGGTITLQGNEVVAQQGSTFNVAGGSLDYQGGAVMQTILQGADGHYYTADTAPAGVPMVSVGVTYNETHPRWGVQYTQSYGSIFTQTNVAVPEASYIVGRDGGQLNLSAPTVIFQGTIDAETVTGADQTTARPASVTDPYKLTQTTAPMEGGLRIGSIAQQQLGYNGNTPVVGYADPYVTQMNVVDGSTLASAPTLDQSVSSDLVNTATVSADVLNNARLGSLTFYTGDLLRIEAPLTLATGGQLTMDAANVEIRADITARGGSVNATNILVSPGVTPRILLRAGVTNMLLDAAIDLRGLWTNALTDPTDLSGEAFVNGGSLNFTFSQGVALTPNSSIDASSGAAILLNGKVLGGKGGDITIVAGRDYSTSGSGLPGSSDAPLILGGTLTSQGVTAGGKLTISTPSTVIISENGGLTQETLAAGTPLAGDSVLASPVTLTTGQISPINVPLGYDWVVPTGTVLSFDLNYSTNIIPAGQAVASNGYPQPSSGQKIYADWTVPPGMEINIHDRYYEAGAVIPAGTTIDFFSGDLPVGYIVPADAFPTGIVLFQNYTKTVPAGTPITWKPDVPAGTIWGAGVPLPVGTLIPAGTLIAKGDVLPVAAKVQQPLPAGTPAPGALVLSQALNFSAGQSAPIDTVLSQTYVLPAGTPVPFNLYYAPSQIEGGQTLQYDSYPNFTPTNSRITQAPWTVPTGSPTLVTSNGYYSPGATIPAGTVITGETNSGQVPGIRAGYTVPADVFPNGMPIQSAQLNYTPGTVLPFSIILPAGTKWAAGVPLPAAASAPAGTTMLAGETFSTPVQVSPYISLTPEFFQSGFSSYDINGNRGLTVADGVQINVVMPVLRVTPDSLSTPTGADPAQALSLWTPPLYLANPNTGTLTQRAGASIALRSTGRSVVAAAGGDAETYAPLLLGQGASITVDPGQSARLESWGQLTVLGDITAHGGAISLVNSMPTAVPANGDPRGLSIWVGGDSTIDASGDVYTALDRYGRTYGEVRAGGSILIGDDSTAQTEGEAFANLPAGTVYNTTTAFTVLRPGSVLDVSGAHATLDLSAGEGRGAPSRLTDVATNAGSISINSSSGFFLDGTMRAFAGGPNAAAGSLNLVLEGIDFFGGPSTNALFNYDARNLTIVQANGPSPLEADLQPGQFSYGYVVGQAQVSADYVEAAGFGSASLFGRDFITFQGDVNLSLPQSITLKEGVLTPAASTPDAQVRLAAPYVLLSGRTIFPYNGNGDNPSGLANQVTTPATAPTGGLFEVDADDIDLQNAISVGTSLTKVTVGYWGELAQTIAATPGFAQINLNSSGDVRFIGAGGSLLTPGDIEVTAAQIYPATGASGILRAGYIYSQFGGQYSETGSLSTSVIDIHGVGGDAPPPPDSAFGSLDFEAGTIDQGGVVRAPYGKIALGTPYAQYNYNGIPDNPIVNLLAGSVTSVSGYGVTMPYGGTPDGITYYYNGVALTQFADAGVPYDNKQGTSAAFAQGIQITSTNFTAQPGSVIDLRGGGDLAGGAFITGRGGSIDVLRTPLVNANPANTASKSSDQVYAIVPGYTDSYAPMDPDKGAGNPAIGQQVTVPAGVPGLPAGVYTLMPSTYALMPGAFRVEVAGSTIGAPGVTTGTAGSYLVVGRLGVANTGVSNSLDTNLIVTPGSAVRAYSQYGETNYDDFLISSSAVFGQRLTALTADAKPLQLNLSTPSDGGTPLHMEGDVLSTAAEGGRGSSVSIIGTNLEILPVGGTGTTGYVSLYDADVNALNAPGLVLGGNLVFQFTGNYQTGQVYYDGEVSLNASATNVVLRSGATISAPQVFVGASQSITLESGASIVTAGKGDEALIQPTDLIRSDGAALVVSNNLLNLTQGYENIRYQSSAGAVNLASGASIRANGSIILGSASGSIGDVDFEGAQLELSSTAIRIGEADAIAAAGGALPPGWDLTPEVLNKLTHGVTPLQSLVLVGTNSVDFVGSVELSTLDSTGKSTTSVEFDTPEILGLGASTDQAVLKTGSFTWDSLLLRTGGCTCSPVVTAFAPLISGGPGSGSGTLSIEADNIIFGRGPGQPTQPYSDDRLMLGFSAVNFTGNTSITSNALGSISVYQAGPSPTTDFTPQSYAGTGGALTLTTPLLTSNAGIATTYHVGGAFTLAAPANSAQADLSRVTNLGGQIEIDAGTVSLDSAVALPTGRLVVNTSGDIAMGAASRIDVSGRTFTLMDQTQDFWGGDVVMDSVHGNITQAAGSTIDVSAANSSAGTITLTAVDPAAGQVELDGAIVGAAGAGEQGGQISIRAQRLDNFAALNATLNNGGLYGARDFDIKQGDLTIDGGVKAHEITISVDGGSLTVDGLIDASGASPGSIRLAARDNLTLGSDVVLDLHGTTLQVDSYGNPIEAENRAYVELTAAQGTLTLAGGATMDLTAPDGIARSEVELDAPRTGETSGDIKISAPAPINIRGASSVAVNAFWTYSPTDAYGTIIQDNLDPGGAPVAASGADAGFVGLNQIDVRNRQFIDAALANSDLQQRLGGLTALGSAFHLRPGVEIDSGPAGVLNTSGDLDFSGFRYGPAADPAVRGSGEPGVVVFRSSGDLNINGNVSDGFEPGPTVNILTGFQLSTTTTTTLTAFTTTTTVSLASQTDVVDGTALANTVTFADLPTPNTASGVYVRGNWFYFPGYAGGCGQFCPSSLATVVSGSVYDGNTGRTISAGQHIGYFSHNTTFAAGTVISISGQSAGTNLFTGSVSEVISSTSVAAAPGTPTGTTTSTQQTANGLQTTTVTTATTNTVLSAVTAAAAPGTPIGTVTTTTDESDGTLTVSAVTSSEPYSYSGQLPALAAMLPQGSLSWGMRFVSGADLASADTRTLQPTSSLQGKGNLTLSNPQIGNGDDAFILFSVVRTGTANLDILAGGDVNILSRYGVYTAGTQSAPVLAANGSDPYQQPLATAPDGSVLINDNSLEYTLAGYQAYYPEHGGDLLLQTQGNLTGYTWDWQPYNGVAFISSNPGAWLWRQGGNEIGQPAAWWINFGSIATPLNTFGQVEPYGEAVYMTGFNGIGTLGGGNLTVIAGGSAGIVDGTTPAFQPGGGYDLPGGHNYVSDGINLAVGATGRVLSDGSVVETGGGALTVRLGGAFSPYAGQFAYNNSLGSGLMAETFTDIRGDIQVTASQIGAIETQFGAVAPGDPRAVNPYATASAQMQGGATIALGDGSATLHALGDLVLADADDPGRDPSYGRTQAASNGQTGADYAWFTLWRPDTAITLMSAGGNVAPLTTSPYAPTDNAVLFPASLSVVAASGNIYGGTSTLELMPSAAGNLTYLAGGSIYGAGPLAMSGASLLSIATPQHPGYDLFDPTNSDNDLYPATPNSDANYISTNYADLSAAQGLNLFVFGPDTITGWTHEGDDQPIRIYAAQDIVDLNLGLVRRIGDATTGVLQYVAAKPAEVRAGRDIVRFGQPFTYPLARGWTTPIDGQTNQQQNQGVMSLFGNFAPTDVSVLSAGRDILYADALVAGPGTLEVTAGRNIYQGDQGMLESLGLLYGVTGANLNGGANITVLAGVGPNGPNYEAFAKLYLNAANASGSAETAGKVVATYQDQLLDWMKTNYDFTGSADDALTAFLALPEKEQSVFLLQVYFQELVASGREYNDPESRRFHSYLRGREAISTLFPDPTGQGDLTMYSGPVPETQYGNNIQVNFDAGIHTDFGGNITVLAPYGQVTVGAQSIIPGPATGLLTQGAGDIDVYSQGDIALGLSRVFTTFGGAIAMWSAQGDINAGRGAKTSVVFAPSRLVYDTMGDQARSPTVPTTGAGIATLSPIPEVPPGDIDLIAPLGTVDAGEAGIRVSGNLNIAALHVVNAANIEVKGTATGLPTAVVVNTGALTAASSAASAVTAAAEQLAERSRPQPVPNQTPFIITGQFLGFGDDQ